jgi:two-component system invasion response regulator UvrY
MIRVLIADDHAVVRRGLRQILSETPDILVEGEAATAPEVRQLVADRRWDVVVLDLNMPGGSGMELIGDLRRLAPGVRVLVLTVSPEEQYAVRAIRAGAAGFLTKESAPEKLIEAVRRLAAGGRYVSAELGETLASVIAGEGAGAPHDRLSDREFEVFKWLSSGRTVSQIAADLALSVKTVSTHRTRILRKMEMHTNAELTHYAVKNGLVE